MLYTLHKKDNKIIAIKWNDVVHLLAPQNSLGFPNAHGYNDTRNKVVTKICDSHSQPLMVVVYEMKAPPIYYTL